jgi:hypothetical protein
MVTTREINAVRELVGAAIGKLEAAAPDADLKLRAVIASVIEYDLERADHKLEYLQSVAD